MARAPIRVAILAGGSGTRFWPLSRASRPKQVLALDGRDGRPLAAAALDRLTPLSEDPPLVVAPESLLPALRRVLPRLARHAFLAEPRPRNTAAAVVLAAETARREAPGAVLLVVPADHRVAPLGRYRAALRAMARRAHATDALVVLGVPPTRATSAYGYLRPGRGTAEGASGRFFRVARYIEKPSPERARRLVADRRHLWGAGTFAFRPESFLAEAARHLPAVAGPIARAFRGTKRASARALAAAYAAIPSISVDHGVMERSNRIEVLAARDLDWDDLGSFEAVGRRRRPDAAGNRVDERVLLVDSRDCQVEGDGPLVALLGVEDLLVARAGDAVLVAKRGREEEVRRVVERLRAQGREDLLR
jgi:mannose-1-phosphate guanylyltransferase/mannose-6-phosphate isomerase